MRGSLESVLATQHLQDPIDVLELTISGPASGLDRSEHTSLAHVQSADTAALSGHVLL